MTKISTFLTGIFLGLLTVGQARAAAPTQADVAHAISEVLVPKVHGWDGILTVAAASFYMQCLNQPADKAWRCEAAGFEGEPWLHNVLTPERQADLIALGFKADPRYGNFVARVPRSTTPDALATRLLGVLFDVYGSRPVDLELHADWTRSVACRPRIAGGRDGGGSMMTATWWPQFLPGTCLASISDDADRFNAGPRPEQIPGAPADGPVELDTRYGPAVAAQIDRLERARQGEELFVVFDMGPAAYFQCATSSVGSGRIYCETASEEADPRVAWIPTPIERRRLLIEDGFTPPGPAINYSRYFSMTEYDPAAIARALLQAARDGYGYAGAPSLTFKTERQGYRPL